MNEDLRTQVILTQMDKFAQGIEGNGQYTRFGLNTLNENRELIDNRATAYNLIRNKYWSAILERCGQHTASLLLQLFISSKSDMYQILTFLFISEMGIQGKARQEIWEQNPIYDNVKFELTAWIDSSLDEELARKIARVTLDYYHNVYMMYPDNNIDELLRWIIYGNNLKQLDPREAMSDEQVSIYNELINNAVGKRIGDMDDRFRLRTNLEFNDWFKEHYEIAPEGGYSRGGLPDWAKYLLVGGAAVLAIKYAKS